MKLEQDNNNNSRSGAAQRKSISGLRLWGLRCTERAAATSGSTSSHWDFSWTKEQAREKGQKVWAALFSSRAGVSGEFLGYLCELAGGESSWRCLWNHSQKKALGWTQDLKRLDLTTRSRYRVRKKNFFFKTPRVQNELPPETSVTWLVESSLAALSSRPSR